MRVEWKCITVDSGVPFAHIITAMLMQELFAKSWVIPMLELGLFHCHLELVKQINQFGSHTFTVRVLRPPLQTVSIIFHGMFILVTATPMIYQYHVLMVSVYLYV